jgi:hypothetical protein
MDYYALGRAAHQASETRRLNSGAALQSCKDTIVGEAAERTGAALAAASHLSKSARRKGIRGNRAAEKHIERDNNQWLFGEDGPSIRPRTAKPEESADSTAYVPASSKLSRIGELIEKEWSKNETDV